MRLPRVFFDRNGLLGSESDLLGKFNYDFESPFGFVSLSCAQKTTDTMKRFRFFRPLRRAVLLTLLTACEGLFPSRDAGMLNIHFAGMPAATRAAVEIPDSSLFLLTVLDDKGQAVYDGTFGNCPDPLEVEPGIYHVSVRSAEFSRPKFDEPVFGDEQVAVVSSGSTVDVALVCTQVNSGIRLKISSDFLVNYPRGLFFVSSEDGRLQYAYREQRIAYFRPGKVDIELENDGDRDILYSRDLDPREILTVAISAPGGAPSTNGHITVEVDTTRNWTGDEFILGSGGGASADGSDIDHAMDVTTARGKTGAEGVWVYGYIVGCASPFLGTTSETNLAIAGRTSVTSKNACLSVELKKGTLRDDLNVVTNPSNMGRKVFLKGDIITYYSIPGVKNITDYRLQ